MSATARYLVGDVFDRLAEIPDGTVDLVLTSPPFLCLRSYLPADHPDKHKEIGSEATPADYLDTLLALTAEWGRVLAPHGSLCVELGDTYSGSGGAGGDYNPDGLREGQERFNGSARANRGGRGGRASMIEKAIGGHHMGGAEWPLAKSLCGIPDAYALSLEYGWNVLRRDAPDSPAGRWRARNKVAWVRPNPPVGALGDKFRCATSYLTIACRARDRYFDLDAVRTHTGLTPNPRDIRHSGAKGDPNGQRDSLGPYKGNEHPAGAPPLDWWHIPPAGTKAAHYAVFPEQLCVRPIEAICPRRVCGTCGKPSRRLTGEATYPGSEKDGARPDGVISRGGKSVAGTTNGSNAGLTRVAPTTGWSTCGCPGTDGLRLDGYHTGPGWRPGHVLDPFAGTGTTGAVATGHGRDCTLIDLDARNADLARDRIGMFLTIDLGTRQAAG